MSHFSWKPCIAVLSKGSRRAYGTKPHDASKLRNMALVAHIGVLFI
jgi:hypothetical protein